MQPSDSININSNSRINGSHQLYDISSGEKIAQLFKFFLQYRFRRPDKNIVSLNRISARKFYLEHRTAFDAVNSFFSKCGVKADKYVYFFVSTSRRPVSDLDASFASKQKLADYAAELQITEKRKKIYKWFMKSVNNIADICIEHRYTSAKDCILALIREKRIATEYITGRISKYFLAAIPSFKDLIPKLDHFAKDEFADLYGKFDIYNTEINNALLKARNRIANPFAAVDEEILKRKRLKNPSAVK